jgi:hypothetical protein
MSSIETTPRPPSGCPHAVKCQVGLHELVVLSSKHIEDGVGHQVDSSVTVDEHPVDWLPVDVTPNVQRLKVLA